MGKKSAKLEEIRALNTPKGTILDFRFTAF
jgi:hypothetical protein